MHRLAFRFKHAHLRTLATGRPVLRPHGLTPARFDLLYAVHQSDAHLCAQSTLRRLLGVARITVSRMLRSLEELGLVTRSERRNGTTRIVQLTQEGIYRINEAFESVFDTLFLQRAYEDSFDWMSLEDAFIAVDNLHSTVMRVAKKLGDTARLCFPSLHPDD